MGCLRINTGPYKPEDDWTGYFVRGDQALGAADLFQTTAKLLSKIDGSNLTLSDQISIDCARLLLSEWADRFSQVYEKAD